MQESHAVALHRPTEESTDTGVTTIDVTDGGAGIRFNFSSAARFRQIEWAEWFDNFDRHELVFSVR